MPTPRNPNPLGCLDFIIYPLVIGVGCFGVVMIGNFLGWIFTGRFD